MNQQFLPFKQRGQLPAKLQGLSHFKLYIYIYTYIYIYYIITYKYKPSISNMFMWKKPEWPKSQKILFLKELGPRTLQHLRGSVANGAHRSLEFCLRSSSFIRWNVAPTYKMGAPEAYYFRRCIPSGFNPFTRPMVFHRVRFAGVSYNYLITRVPCIFKKKQYSQALRLETSPQLPNCTPQHSYHHLLPKTEKSCRNGQHHQIA